MTTFTIDCGPGTLWKCRVVVHPNRTALLKARKQFGGIGLNAEAFCIQRGYIDAHEKDQIAEMHFYKGKGLSDACIVHECAHASVAWLKICRLDLNTKIGDEAFAESLEHLFCGVKFGLRKRT